MPTIYWNPTNNGKIVFSANNHTSYLYRSAPSFQVMIVKYKFIPNTDMIDDREESGSQTDTDDVDCFHADMYVMSSGDL